jgi:protease II
LTIIGSKDKKVGKLLIHIYGFYGISSKITYDNVTIAALEKGWTIAYAHVRGGG